MNNTTEIQTYPLYQNSWVIRQSDPGEEGARNHLFETVSIQLDAIYTKQSLHYQFTRKVENHIEFTQEFADLESLFKFLGESLDPVSLGLLGVKIGQLQSQLA
ncbi:dithiol-disulfide isomerase [Gallibacterium salpingitidis]|uniref:Dithiol-disulfide isomerase n=1 Tax=Gallibacterium salpingitidis TaxID=505341 RepID=A0A1A7Q0L2_9PAST|nr:DUF5377 family protein [Gallibacterium salpingitidis]OBW92503.1 dithiol-disulfide isomerase [Gallibacterium salpingitidis]OBX06945.1 dithiol-disulfide isomerase [Gallibacterium salpingitidis]OBX09455.1 dithiol-disulfide isomerase [Gallibacterium salpingitidis]WKT00342.1 DUF5377 domain-containing protein [Gallibacterium salpingitidis]